MLFVAARRQFLLASVLPNIKQKMVNSITASLNLQLNMTCKLLDYTLDSSITGNLTAEERLGQPFLWNVLVVFLEFYGLESF